MKEINLGSFVEKRHFYEARFSKESDRYLELAIEDLVAVERGNKRFTEYRNAIEKSVENYHSFSYESDTFDNILKKVVGFFVQIVHFISELFKKIGRFIMNIINRIRSRSAVKRLGKNKNRMKTDVSNLSVSDLYKKAKEMKQTFSFKLKTGPMVMIEPSKILDNIKALSASKETFIKNMEDLNERVKELNNYFVGVEKIIADVTAEADKMRSANPDITDDEYEDFISTNVLAIVDSVDEDKELTDFQRSIKNKHLLDSTFAKKVSIGKYVGKETDTEYKKLNQYIYKIILGNRAVDRTLMDIVMAKKDGSPMSSTSPKALAEYALYGTTQRHLNQSQVKVSEYISTQNVFESWFKIVKGEKDTALTNITKELINMLEAVKSADKKWFAIESGPMKSIKKNLMKNTKDINKNSVAKVYVKGIKMTNKTLDNFRLIYHYYATTRMYVAIKFDQYVTNLGKLFDKIISSYVNQNE